MILIRRVEYYETKQDIAEIMHMHSPYDAVEVLTADGPTVISSEAMQKEIIKGRRLRNHNGIDIVVGMSAQVRTALRMELSMWEQLNEDLDHKSQTIKLIYEVNFWQRFKWLFSGVKLN